MGGAFGVSSIRAFLLPNAALGCRALDLASAPDDVLGADCLTILHTWYCAMGACPVVIRLPRHQRVDNICSTLSDFQFQRTEPMRGRCTAGSDL